jgi:alpha-tubulin suppressor-like RCC1 family protein
VSQFSPKLVPILLNVLKVAIGQRHVLALTKNILREGNCIFSWGDNRACQLGRGTVHFV